MNVKIKTPLRYPGGKSRAIKQIIPLIPKFNEFREPMVGGGSIFLTIKQLYPNKEFWINDLNKDLYLFWEQCKGNVNSLIREIYNLKKKYPQGRELYNYLISLPDDIADLRRAARFFILNRITFSGLVDSGGYSEQAYKHRFTESSIKRVRELSNLLKGVKITNLDYEYVVNAPGKNVFIFLDPPYFSTTKSRLYGKNGRLHVEFDHFRFAKIMRKCKHKWLITYDDSPEIRDLFSPFAYIYEWELQYGMNNYKRKHAAKGKEIFISNYELPKNVNRKEF